MADWQVMWSANEWPCLLAKLTNGDIDEWSQTLPLAHGKSASPSTPKRILIRALVERDFTGNRVRISGSMRESPASTLLADDDLIGGILTKRVLLDHAIDLKASIADSLSASGFGVVRHTLSTGTVCWNSHFSEFIGRDFCPDSQTLAQWLAAVHPEDRDLLRSDAYSSSINTEPHTIAFRVMRHDGAIRYLSGKRTVLSDNSGTPIVATFVTKDVTEERVAPKVENMPITDDQFNYAHTNFLTQVSHELRTPLNAILGFAEILEADKSPALSEEQRKRVERIRKSGVRLLEMINHLLDVSRIETGKLKLGLGPVDLLSELQDILSQIANNANARRVRLHLKPPRGDKSRFFVLGDRTRLRRVIESLVTTAALNNLARGLVEITLEQRSNDVALRIENTETAVNDLGSKNLSSSVCRLGERRAFTRGADIGLVVAHQLMELMGGTIQVSSQNENLREMTITIKSAEPADSNQSAESPAERNSDASPNGYPQGRVLYIEDHAVNRALVEGFVSLRPGIELELAVDGESGIASAIRQVPDLILIDMRLPDLHGLQVIQRLRQFEALKRVRCIAVSANAMPQQIDAATAAGFDGYLTKPVSMKMLLAELDRLS